jgi:cytochrome c551/c552
MISSTIDTGGIMKARVLVLAVAGVLAAAATYTASAADLLKAKGCLNCHAIDKKKVGPALKDIAAKYKGKAGAEDELVAKLKTGKGHMKVKASDDELKAVVQQALSQ